MQVTQRKTFHCISELTLGVNVKDKIQKFWRTPPLDVTQRNKNQHQFIKFSTKKWKTLHNHLFKKQYADNNIAQSGSQILHCLVETVL